MAVGLAISGIAGTDPATDATGSGSLHLEVRPDAQGQGVILRWFGPEGVPCQVQYSTNLTTWTESGPILAGTNGWMSVTMPLGEDPQCYFRVVDAGVHQHSAAAAAASGVVTAFFSAGVLTVIGSELDDPIAVSRNVSGQLLVNGGAVSVQGGPATVANTTLINLFGQGGHDTLSLDERNGALPRAQMFGGPGNDILTGGSGADQLFGQSGQDTLLGRGGADFLFGGTENDQLIGGDGNDSVFGESGNDLLIWNPGDDTDLMEGGLGVDTVEVNGGNGAEAFTAIANGTRVRFDRLSPAPFSLDIGTCESLVLNARGGNDTFSATGNLAALIRLTVDGGTGNDTLLGSNGADVLLGGDGDDFIDGQQGNDVVFLGAGNDTFRWDPGDGNDTIEGQGGTDKLLFNGSNASESYDLSANGGRIRFFRNVGSVTLDLDDVERIECRTLGGADHLVVGDLSATDTTQVNVNLAASSGAGDGQPDTVTVNGTNANDTITISGSGTSASVNGLRATVQITGAESDRDRLILNAQGGNDTVDATRLAAGVIGLTLNGGLGDDTLLGSRGDDVVQGGDGNDVALLGAGNDTFVWNPGDDNDTIEGQAGFDTLLFNGSGAAENVELSANGSRLRFFRNVASVVMDGNGLENIHFRALGGSDVVVINDLAGTDVTSVQVALSGPAGGTTGDGQPDSVIVQGTASQDTVLVNGSASGVHVIGLIPAVTITGSEATHDRLTLNLLAGDDLLDASNLIAGLIALTGNGGAGHDVLIGSGGPDVLLGGDGDDVLLGGPGIDILDGGPGQNVVIQD